MDDHQDIDLLLDLIGVGVDGLDLEQLLQLVDHLPRPSPAHPRQRRAGIAAHGKGRHQPDHRPLGVGEVVYQLGQVVFEEAFAGRREERDGFLIVGAVGPGEAEIDHLSGLIQGDALDAEGHRGVLGVRERRRVGDLEPDLAAGERRIFAEQVAHPGGIFGQPRQLLAETGREIEPERHRLVDLGEDRARPCGDGEQLVAGEVHARALEPRLGQDVDGDEQDEGDEEGCQAQNFRAGRALFPGALLHGLVRHPAALILPCRDRRG